MQSYAVFDLDKTLINSTSLLEFYPYYLRSFHSSDADKEVEYFEASIARKFKFESNRMKLNEWYYLEFLRGADVGLLKKSALDWLDVKFKEPGFFIRKVVRRLEEHQRSGYKTIILTGSFREIVEPICRYLGIDRNICAPLVEVDGNYTGYLCESPTIGFGKREALTKFCKNHDICLRSSFGYGDDSSDIPFLEMLGNPHLVCHTRAAGYEIAERRGWNVVEV